MGIHADTQGYTAGKKGIYEIINTLDYLLCRFFSQLPFPILLNSKRKACSLLFNTKQYAAEVESIQVTSAYVLQTPHPCVHPGEVYVRQRSRPS